MASTGHQNLVRDIANAAHVAVVLVDYHHLQGKEYRIAFDEAYEATKYIAEHAWQFNVDPERLAIVGDGVGGSVVAAVSFYAESAAGRRSVSGCCSTP